MEQQIRVLQTRVIVGALLSSVFATTTVAADIAVQPDGQGLQAALEQARCGDTIRLQAGIYQEDIDTVRDCSADQPLTIIGPSGAVIKGNSDHRIFEVKHSHHHLIGFTIDGLNGDSAAKSSYKDKLLYAVGSPEGYIDGLKIISMTFKNAGGECVRLKYTQNSEVAGSTFATCGTYDFRFNEGGKNGEGVYIGTSSNQWTSGPDQSSHNWVHDNTFNTGGNECVEVKEGSEFNLIEHNRCTGQQDADSAGIGLRGSRNTVRYNQIYGNVGAGVRIGGHTIDGTTYGIASEVYGNTIYDNAYAGVKIMTAPQTAICGNEVRDNPGGPIRGDHEADFDPAAACVGALTPDDVPDESPPSPAPLPEPDPAPDDSGDVSEVLAVAAVMASDDDGNVPANTLDNDLQTRWSAKGNKQWIQYDLGAASTVSAIDIAFYKGTERTAKFSLMLSDNGNDWMKVLDMVQSSGSSDQLQTFEIAPGGARFVRIVGYGNSSGNGWNSLTEVAIRGH